MPESSISLVERYIKNADEDVARTKAALDREEARIDKILQREREKIAPLREEYELACEIRARLTGSRVTSSARSRRTTPIVRRADRGSHEENVLATLRAHPEGLSNSDLHAQMTDPPSKPYLSRVRDRMLTKGLITRGPDGLLREQTAVAEASS